MPIKEHFLYSDVIEPNGKLNREPTFAGAVLLIVVGVVIAVAVGYFFFVIVPVAFQ